MADRAATTREVSRSLFASQTEDESTEREDIDFKMVTFSLGGKDYGIDIMRVKEIAKYEQFTYVPNTQPFVAGVYNLRGDIISVIDLRVMFNLPASQRAAGDTVDGLIVRLDTGLIGVIVDSIDKVVGISSESIQPPHPIFADINIKYISGVVEHESKLYIILDAERILGDSAEEAPAEAPAPVLNEPDATPSAATAAASMAPATSVDNVAKTLETLSGFVVTGLNRGWVEKRLAEWESQYGDKAITTQSEVEDFLGQFYSTDSGRFWQGGLLESVMAVMPTGETGNLSVWNPGCGKGYESYSIAIALRKNNPAARVKVWASDSDLISISTAPNLTVDERSVPEAFREYLVEGTSGFTFEEDIRKSILFEFSDITNAASFPPAEIVVMRDVLSFLPEPEQQRISATISERMGPSARIIVGTNEDLSALGGFKLVSEGVVRVFAPE